MPTEEGEAINKMIGEEPVVKPEDGDIYDEDTGIWVGNIGSEEVGMHAIQELSVFADGWWYVFKRDRRYKDEP